MKRTKGLFLYGINCTQQVWASLQPLLPSWDCELLPYPHEVTREAACLSDLAQWVARQTAGKRYDAIVGHSLGGLIALELAAAHSVPAGRIICLDTNLKPAGAFFRNLMTEAHMERFGLDVHAMMAAERPYYTAFLMQSLREDFDYTALLPQVRSPVYLLLGDRGRADAADHLGELNLPPCAMERLHIRFVADSCHMPMLENPVELAQILREICDTEGNA